MKKRILESEEKLLVDDDGINGKSDPLDSLEKDDLYSHYSDLYKEKHNIRPRWVHPSDVSVEELRRMIDDLYQDSGYLDDEDDYSDHEDNKKYFDDLDAKSSEDSEIENLASLGPEDGEEFHTLAGMGKGRRGRNRIHEKETDEVAPPGGEKLVKALKKQKGVKNPWAIAWSKYNKGELKENTLSNKITIGQLRQVIKEELDNQKYLHGYESDHPTDDEGEMIKTKMSGLKRMSEEIEGALKNEDQLPAWVQDLVAQSYSTLEHVHAYLMDNSPKKAKMK